MTSIGTATQNKEPVGASLVTLAHDSYRVSYRSSSAEVLEARCKSASRWALLDNATDLLNCQFGGRRTRDPPSNPCICIRSDRFGISTPVAIHLATTDHIEWLLAGAVRQDIGMNLSESFLRCILRHHRKDTLCSGNFGDTIAQLNDLRGQLLWSTASSGAASTQHQRVHLRRGQPFLILLAGGLLAFQNPLRKWMVSRTHLMGAADHALLHSHIFR